MAAVSLFSCIVRPRSSADADVDPLPLSPPPVLQLLYSNKCARVWSSAILFFVPSLTARRLCPCFRSEGCQIEQEYLSNFEQVLDVFVSPCISLLLLRSVWPSAPLLTTSSTHAAIRRPTIETMRS